jgi:hypothetical protein
MNRTIEAGINETRIQDLRTAISTARGKHGITVMCAFSDQGMSAPANSTFPTAWRSCCNVIGAATKGGDASPLVNKNVVDFLFPGENIVIEAKPSQSLTPAKAGSGSSISTALAAGTAAMLLFITQLVDAKLYEKLKDPGVMKVAFGRLCAGEKGNGGRYFDARKFSQFQQDWRWEDRVYNQGRKAWEAVKGRGFAEAKKLVEEL